MDFYNQTEIEDTRIKLGYLVENEKNVEIKRCFTNLYHDLYWLDLALSEVDKNA